MGRDTSCDVCGYPIPEGAPEGICPQCLLNSALGEETVAAGNPRLKEDDGADQRAAAQPLDAIAFESPGTQIGAFHLIEKIGEGGFGVVYSAEQSDPVKRVVALKILKPGMDSKEVLGFVSMIMNYKLN